MLLSFPTVIEIHLIKKMGKWSFKENQLIHSTWHETSTFSIEIAVLVLLKLISSINVNLLTV